VSRALATALRPPILDEGLQAAVEWQAREFEARTGIRCAVDLNLEQVLLPAPASTALFRIIQEVLTNVVRHSSAGRVSISSDTNAGSLVISVADDGTGMDEADADSPDSLGLLGMRERARALDGEVSFKSARGKGTTVTVRIPVQAPLVVT